ncbi:hypothetical protein M8494_02900 [Serratia ureilytica]
MLRFIIGNNSTFNYFNYFYFYTFKITVATGIKIKDYNNMKIDIFSECTYTIIGIRQLINQTWSKNTPADFNRRRVCFIDVTLANFEARYRDEYANPKPKIVIITDCPHEMVIVDNKTIILSNLISLSRFSHLIGDLYTRYSHYTEPPQLSRRESFSCRSGRRENR